MTIIALLLSLTILTNIVLGVLVLARTYRLEYGTYFALTVFGVAVWSLGDLFLLSATRTNLVDIGAYIFYVGPTIIPVGILLFSLGYPDNRHLPRKLLGTMALLVVGWGYLFGAHRSLFIKSITILPGMNVAQPRLPGFLFYAAYFSVLFLFTYYVLIKKYRHFSGLAKTQISYTLYAVIISSFLALFTNLTLPIQGITQLIWMGPILTLIFVAIVAYAIVRHQLFDIRLIVARSVGYLFSLSTLAAAYGLIISFVTFVVSEHTASSRAAQSGITVVLLTLAALTYAPLKKYFDKVSNRLFYRDAYDSQVFLDDLNRILVSDVNVNSLLQKTAAVIRDTLKVEYCTFGLKETTTHQQRFIGDPHKFIPEDTQYIRDVTPTLHSNVIMADYSDQANTKYYAALKRNDIAILVRLTSSVNFGDPAVGYLLLGAKKSGNPFSGNDLRLIQIIANELVIAIQNALRFEEIQNFNVTLQQRIEEATHKLRNANKRLTELDETKDDFISMASHQLRTPLTSVKGYLSLVLEGDAGTISPMQRKLLSQAFTSSQRMVYLIADLLNVSRLKTGKFVIEAVPSNLADVVQEEIAQLKETLDSHSLKLVYNKPAHFPDLMLDETKTRQVVMNFIDNAIYYTPAGGTITVNLKDKPAAIELTVVDNGIGVPKAEQHHLFTKFYRANNARKTRPDGTGLGLFMAKKVILAQGGAVIFESAEGKGSTFGFTLSKSKLGVPAGTNGSATTGIAKSLAKV